MSFEPEEQAVRARNVRLDTLVRLRWVAVIGQTTAVLVVHFGLDFELPIWACLAVIALAAWLNVALRIRFRATQRLEPDRAAWLLAFDIAELAILVFLTGGLQNPFSFLLLGPVLLSATALPPQMTVTLGAFAAVCATVLIFYHYPLPWDSDEALALPAIYTMGIWLSLLLALGFIGVHAWQLTEESRQLADALAATELVLAREQHLSQLDGLAAAAAPELGNLVENAVDFARARVDVAADWSGDDVGVTITDDGPGFAPEIMDRIGEPYVTSTRRRRLNLGGEAGGGLGLGFFIAKTLLERS